MRRYGLVDIPDQASDIDAVPITRTITINGTTYDLSANRTWTVGGITGSGTLNYVSKWTSSTALGDSLIYDNGISVGIGTASPSSANLLQVQGIVASITNKTYAGGSTLSTPVGSTQASTNYTFGGNITIPASIVTSSVLALSNIEFTSTGTVTQTQSSNLRAVSNILSQWSYTGTVNGTITHLANLRLNSPYSTSSATLSITNYYGIIIEDSSQFSPFTITNRYGIYQYGANDKNYFEGDLQLNKLIGTGSRMVVADSTGLLSTQTIPSSTISIGDTIGSATAGSIFFAGTSGVLAQNNSNFYWDNTNNRLGLGTTTPNTNIHIYSTGNSGNGIRIENPNAGTSAAQNLNLFVDSTAGYLQFQKRSSTHTATGIANASSGLLYNSAGDLIIGLGGATSWLRFATNGIATADMNLTANGRLLLGTSTESTFIFDAVGNSRITGDSYITSKQWVGTSDTTSPGTLTVYGTSAANQIRVVGTTPTTLYTDIFGTGTATIIGAVGGCSTANNFVTGTVAGDFVVVNQMTTKRLYCVSNTGGVYLATNATSWTANSDIRLKNINSYITNAVDKLYNLNVINYHLKEDVSKKESIGLIAQELIEVLPEIVETSEVGILGIRYTELIPVLVKAIQELKDEIELLKNK